MWWWQEIQADQIGLNLTKWCSQIFPLFQNNLHVCYLIYTANICWKNVAPLAVIPQSYRPNRCETDTEPTIIVKFAYKLVWIRYWLSVSKTCRLPVRCLCWCGVTSVRKRLWTCRFSFGHRWHMVCWFTSANIVPTQDRHVPDISGTQT